MRSTLESLAEEGEPAEVLEEHAGNAGGVMDTRYC